MMYFYNNGRLLLILLNLLVILFSTGCAFTDSSQKHTSLVNSSKISSSSDTPFVSGHILLADNFTPANNVTVYIPNVNAKTPLFINELVLSSSSSAERSCEKPLAPYISFTCTDVNGHFKLPVTKFSSPPLSITVQSNEVTVSTAISLSEIGSDIGAITLIDREALGAQKHDKDRIAIVFDLLDPYEEINRTLAENDISPDLIRIEMLQNFYDIYEINENKSDVKVTTLQELVKDQNRDKLADIADFDVIFINCRNEDDIANLNATIRKELLKFVSNGGELFITSWSFQLEKPKFNLNDYI